MTKKKNKQTDEMEKLQQAIFEREVDEELQREKLRIMWQKYRFAIIGFVVGVLLVTIGNEVYHSWRQKVSLEESNAFENASILAYTGDTDKAKVILEKLAKEGDTGYRALSEMKLAGIYLSQNDRTKALASLQKVMSSDAPEQLKAVATIAYVGQTFETENAQKLRELLKPLLNSDSAFAGSAAELTAALYLKEGDNTAAVKTLQDAIANPVASPVVRQRLSELLSVIEEE